MHTRSRLRIQAWAGALLLLGALIGAGGCSTGKPIARWQDQVEKYIDEEAGGNLVALRHLNPDLTRQRFDFVGTEEGLFDKTRTDVQAVMLGPRQVQDETWWLFLLGVVTYQGGVMDVSFDHPELRNIYAAVMRRNERPSAGSSGPIVGYTWIVGPANEAAVDTYARVQLEAWRQSHPDRSERQRADTRFPTAKDRYRVERAGTVLTVHEEHTGTSWSVDVARDPYDDAD